MPSVAEAFCTLVPTGSRTCGTATQTIEFITVCLVKSECPSNWVLTGTGQDGIQLCLTVKTEHVGLLVHKVLIIRPNTTMQL